MPDIANLTAGDADWKQRHISYQRLKTKEVALLHFTEAMAVALRKLPADDALFPCLKTVRPRRPRELLAIVIAAHFNAKTPRREDAEARDELRIPRQGASVLSAPLGLPDAQPAR